MKLRATLYDVLGVGFVVGSAYFFYRAVEFLARADYVAGLLTMVVALLVVRAGVDICRLAVASIDESSR